MACRYTVPCFGIYLRWVVAGDSPPRGAAHATKLYCHCRQRWFCESPGCRLRLIIALSPAGTLVSNAEDLHGWWGRQQRTKLAHPVVGRFLRTNPFATKLVKLIEPLEFNLVVQRRPAVRPCALDQRQRLLPMHRQYIVGNAHNVHRCSPLSLHRANLGFRGTRCLLPEEAC